jgi:hypothetical protein
LTAIRLPHYAKAKDAAGCRALAEMLEKLKPTDGLTLYNIACMRAVTAALLRETDNSHAAAQNSAAEAELAMGWLKQALAAGFKDIQLLRTDKDLDALRDREDFQKLLAGLEANKEQDKK